MREANQILKTFGAQPLSLQEGLEADYLAAGGTAEAVS